MTTPTPSAHSGEQGKPSDRAIATAVRRLATFDWTGVSAVGLLDRIFNHANVEDARRSLERSEALERKHEQSEPEADDYREVMAKLSGPLRSIWAVMGPRVPRHWDCGGAAFEWNEALRVLRDAANNAPPPSDQAGISDEVVERFSATLRRKYYEAGGQAEFVEPWLRTAIRAALQSAFPRGVGSGIFEAYKTWPNDIRAKLSAHDLRRMSGWAPLPNGAWRIDTSAGRPILMYEDCSVIEAEVATYVLSLINRDAAHPAPEAQAEGEPALYQVSANCYPAALERWVEVTKDEYNSGLFPAAAWNHRKLYLRPQPSTSEKPSASETPSAKDAYLIIGYGESDVPDVKRATTHDEIRAAFAALMFGDPKACGEDADSEIDDMVERFNDPDEWSHDGRWSATFEIGGINAYRLAAQRKEGE